MATVTVRSDGADSPDDNILYFLYDNGYDKESNQFGCIDHNFMHRNVCPE